MSKSEYFVLENEVPGSSREERSPSGKYRLVISRFTTKAGCWNYSQGKVFCGEKEIATVQRNYGSFPFLFVEAHSNGHDYLICGEDYQGQTVIELDTGKIRNNLSDGYDKGCGFCWADYKFEPSQNIVVVDGCHWACPYEFKFFDFNDPMSGWSELEFETGIYVDNSGRWPEFLEDGTIKCFQVEFVESDDDDEEDPKPEDCPIASTQIFKREGNRLLLVNSWVSDKEKETRRLREENQRKFDEWLAEFRKSDPMYLEMKEQLKSDKWEPESYDSTGVTHDGWCPDFKLRERRMCRRIHKGNDFTFDLEWATETGPVKLISYKGGKSLSTNFFEHSSLGIRQAFDKAKEIRGSS